MLVRNGMLVDSNLLARVTLLPNRQYLDGKSRERKLIITYFSSIHKFHIQKRVELTSAFSGRRRRLKPFPCAARCASSRFNQTETGREKPKINPIAEKLINPPLSQFNFKTFILSSFRVMAIDRAIDRYKNKG